jgi:hypothetical protein
VNLSIIARTTACISRTPLVSRSPESSLDDKVHLGHPKKTRKPSSPSSSFAHLRSAAAAIVMFGVPLNCPAQQGPCTAGTSIVSVTPGFFSGAELNSLNDDELGMYAMGYVDALQAATMIGVTENCRRALQTCVVQQNRTDFTKAIRKYLRENPNRWDERSNGILYNVLFSQCLRGY